MTVAVHSFSANVYIGGITRHPQAASYNTSGDWAGSVDANLSLDRQVGRWGQVCGEVGDKLVW